MPHIVFVLDSMKPFSEGDWICRGVSGYVHEGGITILDPRSPLLPTTGVTCGHAPTP